MSIINNSLLKTFKIKYDPDVLLKFIKEDKAIFIVYKDKTLCKYNTDNIELLIIEFFSKLTRSNKIICSFKKENVYFTEGYIYTFNDILNICGITIYKENLIRNTKAKLGISYIQLGKLINVSPNTLRAQASKSVVSPQMSAALKLLMENIELKNKIKELENKNGN